MNVDSQSDERQQIKWKHSLRSIKQLAYFAPDLIYLNVEKCYNLKDYDFSDFKCLRTLCVDAKLGAILPTLPKTIRKFIDLS